MFGILLGVLSALLLNASCRKKVREPAFAGQFYPEDPAELNKFINEIMNEPARIITDRIYAMIVPHSGYQLSAGVAAAGFVQINREFDKAFIIAANHNGKAIYKGASLDTDTHYGIPGGEITVSTKIVRQLLNKPIYKEIIPANALHMIEVELPFLKKTAELQGGRKFKIIPEILGVLDDKDAEEITKDINYYYDDNTLLIASMDFSHYFPYEKAVEKDRYCINAVLTMDEAAVKNCETDSNQVLKVILRFAKLNNLTPKLLAYRNSGDITGDRKSVVGYTSIVFIKNFNLSKNEKKILLDIAKKSIEEYVKTGGIFAPPVFPRLTAKRASFVTLKKDGKIRGRMGQLIPQEEIHLSIRNNAIAAATKDIRFPPVTREELNSVTIEVSILDYPQQMILKEPAEVVQFLKPGTGLILNYHGQQAALQPDEWAELASPGAFVSALCKKMSAPKDCWKQSGASFYIYTTISFSDK